MQMRACVYPVVIRSTVLCTVCSFFVLVSDIISDQMVFLYSSVVLLIAVYVLSSVSLDFPQCLVGRGFSIFVVFFNLSVMFCICFEKRCLGSNVNLEFLCVCGECCVVSS